MSSVCKDDVSSSVPASPRWRQAGKVCAVYLHRPPCQRVNKGHPSISFQAATLFAFPQPPRLPETGGEEALVIFAYFQQSLAWTIKFRASLWSVNKMHSANHQGTKADDNNNKKIFFLIFYFLFTLQDTVYLFTEGDLLISSLSEIARVYFLALSLSAQWWTEHVDHCQVSFLGLAGGKCVHLTVCPSIRLATFLSQALLSCLMSLECVSFLPRPHHPSTPSPSFLDFPVRPFPWSFQPEWFPPFLPL